MFWNISRILANVWLRNVTFENVWITVVLLIITFSFKYFEVRLLFLFFPSRMLFVTFDIQIDLGKWNILNLH